MPQSPVFRLGTALLNQDFGLFLKVVQCAKDFIGTVDLITGIPGYFTQDACPNQLFYIYWCPL
jgi:hypothetical protein